MRPMTRRTALALPAALLGACAPDGAARQLGGALQAAVRDRTAAAALGRIWLGRNPGRSAGGLARDLAARTGLEAGALAQLAPGELAARLASLLTADARAFEMEEIGGVVVGRSFAEAVGLIALTA